MPKIVKWLGTILLGLLIFKGLTTEVKVEASTVGQLTKERSSISGRMEFRHPQATQNTYEDYIILKVNGEVVFCLDPTVYVHAGEYIGQNFSGNEVISDRITVGMDTMIKIVRSAYFGYKLNPTHKNYHYTQALIWEILGWTARSFSGGLSMAEYQAWKAATLSEINGYQRVSSFTGNTYTLKVGQSVTMTDDNNVLQNLTIPVSQNGYNFIRNGNQLTIKATKDAVDGEVEFKQPFDRNIHGATIVYRKPDSQTVASTRLGDPQYASINLKALKHAKIQITKTSSTTGKGISDVEFTLYDATTNAVVKTAVTNANGVAEFLDLEADRKFYFKETRAAKGYMLNETRYDYVAVASETKNFNIKNEPVPTIVSKAATSNGQKQVFAHDIQHERLTVSDLTIGNTYTLVSFQMDKNTRRQLSDTQKVTFKATSNTYTHTFAYNNIASTYQGDVVYGAWLYNANGKKIAEHFDFENKAQTVTVVKPAMTSKATTNTGAKVGHAIESHKETVNVTGLIPQLNYRLVSFAMSGTNKKQLGDFQSIMFKPTGSTYHHTFTYNGLQPTYQGDVVYGARLYYGNRLLHEHFDWNNKQQTVMVVKPTMTSVATSDTGGKTAFSHQSYKETVTITGLIPNQSYRLVSYAKLPQGKTQWKEQTITFTPKSSTHTQIFTYTGVSKDFAGDIVYGAKLYLGNTLLHEHFDWKNKVQTVTVVKPAMTSVATSDTGGKTAFSHQSHKETVTITGLIPNQSYRLVSYAKLPQGKTQWKEQTIIFTPKSSTHTHIFTYIGVSKDFAGDIVYGAKLYLGNTLLHEHFDWKNKAQIVTVVKPTMTSVATSDTGGKTAFSHQSHKETVTITGLIPNQAYRLVSYAKLPQWNTQWKEQTIIFTPKSSTHTQTFTYTGVSKDFAGDIVYGAKLYLGNTLLHEHFDWKNKAQTVTVVKPAMTSVATTNTGAKVGHAIEPHKETVNVTGLIPQLNYRLVSFAMSGTNQKQLGDFQSVVFKPTGSTYNHTFTYDGLLPTYHGDVVYGARLYYGNRLLHEHFDFNNKAQTVTVVTPTIVTVATTQNGQKSGYRDEKHIEKVTINHVIAGRTYELVARQYDKSGKLYVTQKRTIKPTTSTHVETFEFSVPAGFSGYLVYAQELLLDGKRVANHFDLNNASQTVYVDEPEVTTVATTVTGGKVGYEYEDHKEIANVTGLIIGRQYKLVATQYDKTGKAYATQTRTFKATEKTHTEEFIFSVPKGFKGYLVYGQVLHDEDSQVAVHYDLNNKNQTVEIIEPDVVTEATTQSGGKVGYQYEDHKEVAKMTGLIVGRKYKVVATQYDETGKVYATQRRTFTADKTERTEVFMFKVPVSFVGTIVYGEDLYSEGKKVATHYDLKSIPQSVKVIKPTITTQATTVKGGKVGYEYEDHKEIAVMTNLIAGREYEVVATQYDKTGKAYATQKATFTAKESTHTHEFIFSVPKGFKGYLVYGEILSYNGKVIATHYDLENKDQTVEIIEPDVVTEATTQSGGKVGYQYEDHKEVAKMTGLIVGRKYKVVATQYDETGKVYATQEREFTADKTEHTEVFTFKVPVSFTGTIVYGEDLYSEGKKVAKHYDLKSIPQSVKVVEPTISTVAKVGGKTELVKGQKVTVTDTLTYTNFKNEEVAIKTWIVKYGTDEKVSEVYTRIVKLNGNGEVTVTLDGFDISKLPVGKYTLMEQVFEVKDGKVTDKLLAEHVDNKDEKQMFKVWEPELPDTGSGSSFVTFIVGGMYLLFSFIFIKIKRKRNYWQ